MSIIFKPKGSLDIATDPSDLKEEKGTALTDETGKLTSYAMTRCKNLRLDKTGMAQTRLGTDLINASAIESIGRIIEQGGDRYEFAGTGIYKNEVSIESEMTDAEWFGILYNSYNDLTEDIFALNGTDRIRIENDVIYEWGIDAPTVAPTAKAISNGSLTEGAYKVKYTYCRKVGAVVVCESNPSEESDAVSVADGGALAVTVTQPTDTQVTHIRFYRTLFDGDTYYYDIDAAAIAELTAVDFAYCFDWEGDGSEGLQYYQIIGTDYSVSHEWEETDEYISGDAFTFTTSTDNCFTWEETYGTASTITATTVTGPDDYQYASAYFDLSEYDYYIDGTGRKITTTDDDSDIEYIFTMELELSEDESRYAHRMYDFEDMLFILDQGDGDLGSEVATDHERPPLGSFVSGPNYNGTCFIIKDNLLYFCKPKQPEYWPTLYYVEIASPQFPSQCVVFYDGAPYVLTKHHIFHIQGTAHDSFFPYDMKAITGAVNPNAAWAVTGYGIFHVGMDGIYLYLNGLDKKITQTNLDPIFNGETVGGVPAVSRTDNCWLFGYRNQLWFGYTSAGYSYPTNIIVLNLDASRMTYYSYSMEIRTLCHDRENNRLLAGDKDGYVWELETGTDDHGTAISWEVQSKDYMLQTRAHFPRWIKYDVDASDSVSASAYLLLDGVIHQTHTLTGINRNVKKRLVKTGNGQKAAIRIAGSGPVSIYMVEGE